MNRFGHLNAAKHVKGWYYNPPPQQWEPYIPLPGETAMLQRTCHPLTFSHCWRFLHVSVQECVFSHPCSAHSSVFPSLSPLRIESAGLYWRSKGAEDPPWNLAWPGSLGKEFLCLSPYTHVCCQPFRSSKHRLATVNPFAGFHPCDIRFLATLFAVSETKMPLPWACYFELKWCCFGSVLVVCVCVCVGLKLHCPWTRA